MKDNMVTYLICRELGVGNNKPNNVWLSHSRQPSIQQVVPFSVHENSPQKQSLHLDHQR